MPAIDRGSVAIDSSGRLVNSAGKIARVNVLRDMVRNQRWAVIPTSFANGTACSWNPMGSTSVTAYGSNTNLGRAFSAATPHGRVRRGVLTSAATANSSGGVRLSSNSTHSLSNFEPMRLTWQFGGADAAAVANVFSVSGFVAQSGEIGGSAFPSVGMIAFGAKVGDTELSFLHGTSGVAVSEGALGVNFPANSGDEADLYEASIWQDNAAEARVNWSIRNLKNDAVASGVVTTDLPGLTTSLYFHSMRGNGGTALAVSVVFGAAEYGDDSRVAFS